MKQDISPPGASTPFAFPAEQLVAGMVPCGVLAPPPEKTTDLKFLTQRELIEKVFITVFPRQRTVRIVGAKPINRQLITELGQDCVRLGQSACHQFLRNFYRHKSGDRSKIFAHLSPDFDT